MVQFKSLKINFRIGRNSSKLACNDTCDVYPAAEDVTSFAKQLRTSMSAIHERLPNTCLVYTNVLTRVMHAIVVWRKRLVDVRGGAKWALVVRSRTEIKTVARVFRLIGTRIQASLWCVRIDDSAGCYCHLRVVLHSKFICKNIIDIQMHVISDLFLTQAICVTCLLSTWKYFICTMLHQNLYDEHNSITKSNL